MPSTRACPRERTYKALLIGNAEFTHAAGHLLPLRGSLQDVLCMGEALADDDVGLHDADDISVVRNGTKRDVDEALLRFFASGRDGDQLLLYYSGHGRRTALGQLYLCTKDTEVKDDLVLAHTAIDTGRISAMARDSSAPATVIILDCCYSGAFAASKGEFTVPGLLQGTGVFGLFSGRYYEETPDATPLTDTSPFTDCVARALRLGTLDRDNDGFADLGDIYSYVFTHLPSTYQAIPTWMIPTPSPGTVALARARQRGAEGHYPRLERPSFILPDGPPTLVPVPPDCPRFMIAQFLVTNRQYAEFLAEPENAEWRRGGRRAANKADTHYLEHWDRTFPAGQGNHPVVNISAWAAQAYVEWASRMSGRNLKLPTLAEWEESARAGRPDAEFIADDVHCGGVNYGMTERRPTDVGLFAPNPYGIGDLVGNAFDLCWDDTNEEQADNPRITICGGAYHSPEVHLGTPRHIRVRDCRSDVGFRCVARTLREG
jgi:formylglycine-generating enzyme required for sulfatase activity